MAICKANGITIALTDKELQVLGMVLITYKGPATPEQEDAIISIKEAIKPFWVNS